MLNTIFAKKVGMTARYTGSGRRVGATILEVQELKVVGKREKEKHGYEAVVVEVRSQNSKGVTKMQKLKELRGQEHDGEIKFEDILKPGDFVKVSGISKGHGFTGVVKRYNFRGGPRTHGQSDRERARGSSGSTTTPGRVFRGKRMAGRMGNQQVTTRNLEVLEVDPATKRLVLKGSVAGSQANLVTIVKN